MSVPIVQSLKWGQVMVAQDSAVTQHKDVKIWPTGHREWDWRETGTRHRPGVQPSDIQELIANGAEVLVLSQGMNEQLQVPASTVSYARSHGVDVFVLPTQAAVKKYKELVAANKKVGALLHSTC